MRSGFPFLDRPFHRLVDRRRRGARRRGPAEAAQVGWRCRFRRCVRGDRFEAVLVILDRDQLARLFPMGVFLPFGAALLFPDLVCARTDACFQFLRHGDSS